MLKVNSCDGLYDSLDIRFTKKCDNNCSFCIEKNGIDFRKESNIDYLVDQTIKTGIKNVLILGGEPLLYIDRVIDYLQNIRSHVDTIYLTTSIPKQCEDMEKMEILLNLLDGLNLSVHHYNEKRNNDVLNASNDHNRLDIINKLCKIDSSKIRVCVNLVKGHIDNKYEIHRFLGSMYHRGVRNIKLNELQNSDLYVSFEKCLDGFIKLKSPFSNGCQTEINIYKKYWDDLNVILKRSCFLTEKSLYASFKDLVKVLIKSFIRPKNNFKVMYEDGSIKDNWETIK